jgi:two-component system, NtrC family, response regulator AtoC
MNASTNSMRLDPITEGFIYGLGSAMQSLNGIVSEIARTRIPVLIVGESGVGKDAYAHLIHRLSLRGEAPLKKINCAVPSPGLRFENMHEATRRISGSTPGGTLYLDNIHELDVASQEVLRSYLTESDVESREAAPSSRVISSSLRALENEVAANRFSRELYFHVNGACLRLPPLRERRDDIPVLMEHFLTKHVSAGNRSLPSLDRRAFDSLQSYHWPGNIRELENLAKKMIAFGDSRAALHDLQSTAKPANGISRGRKTAQPLKVVSRVVSRQAERQLIMQALERTRWNKKRAAEELQISYKSLLHKIKQIGSLNGDHEG